MRYYQILSEVAKDLHHWSNYALVGALTAVLTGALLYKHYHSLSEMPRPSSIGMSVSGGLEEKLRKSERLPVDEHGSKHTSHR